MAQTNMSDSERSPGSHAQIAIATTRTSLAVNLSGTPEESSTISHENDEAAAMFFSTYLRLTYSSRVEMRARRFVNARICAGESVLPMFDALFGWMKRKRPILVELESEIEHLKNLFIESGIDANSSDLQLFSHDVLLPTIQHLFDGHTATQSSVFTLVESVARKHSVIAGTMLKGWSEEELSTLRPPTNGSRFGESKNGPTDESTSKLVMFINRKHGLDYELVRRLDGGYSTGAFLLRRRGNQIPIVAPSPSASSSASIPDDSLPITAPSSTSSSIAAPNFAVLKWTTRRSSLPILTVQAAIIAHAISCGYPSPVWLAFGASPSGFPYHVQEFVEGAVTVRKITRSMAKVMIRSFEMQRGFHDAPNSSASRSEVKNPLREWNWVSRTKIFVFESPDMKRVIVESTPEAAALHSDLMVWVAPCMEVDLPSIDLVHGDLNLSNILVLKDTSSNNSHDDSSVASTSYTTAGEWPEDAPVRLVFVDTECLGYGSVFYDVMVVLLGSGRVDLSDGAISLLLDYAINISVDQPLQLRLAVTSRIVFLLYHAVTDDPHEYALKIRDCRRVVEAIQTRENTIHVSHQ